MSTDSIKKIEETMVSYKKLLDILADHEDNKQVCKLSKKKISELYGLSYTGTCNKLKFLVKYGIIEEISKGFVRTGKQVSEAKPFLLLPRLMVLVLENPDIYSSYKEQAELFNESISDVQTAWGFYSYYFGAKYPKTEEVQLLEQENKAHNERGGNNG
ncbi:hypothetical protein [Halalkalibacter akibai]|uniref:Uncharacterized protein n=1 Tax=Halalkalibacter akibai (strain ATCC 43226 / DSM 21942 / CIP 109018 / JCM 9157 / 1139) TaxID=1236973 RepID=W4R038_HALA3|nr:hypothetical protein [Halalkalibacter akibai]GAE37512.1 hypothetical protein JCM9157_4819 [Halalkalibacter akibai JCM 9157]